MTGQRHEAVRHGASSDAELAALIQQAFHGQPTVDAPSRPREPLEQLLREHLEGAGQESGESTTTSGASSAPPPVALNDDPALIALLTRSLASNPVMDG